MIRLLGAIMAACILRTAAAQSVAGKATEFVPVNSPLDCGFIVRPAALAVLLSPEAFDPSQCQAVIGVTFNGTEVDMRVAGSCDACEGNDIEISTEGYQVLGAPLGSTIDVTYLIG
ncbi:hypothetical protein DFH08DRAFT_932459 [Mycena albidolilacea]|uniref:Uncharacterized protein n=1 Tax=Mycena albidolilacea TaxID=1033008 RepID=A0AAD7AHC5_9AGAR|nr:hypothetical protein DFH08DRAFT_932459 [Mycena albidolilacea]